MGGAPRQNMPPKGVQAMPWTETDVMDQRTEFVLRAMKGVEDFSELCREYGISRKTGYKWQSRFVADGLSGLGDQSRRPKKSPKEIGEAMVCQIVNLKVKHPGWGPRKVREVLKRIVNEKELPSESTCKRILDKAGLVRRRRRNRKEQGTRLQTPVKAERPNQVWTIDFKGWWYTRNRGRFEPLTIRDDYSRYVLCAQTLENACSDTVREQMKRVFQRHGLPEVIRSDNGSPFAASNSPLGLSRLSAWWLALGINLDRIAPGRPDQNGGHERMHRDVANEVEARVEDDVVTQQAALDVWRKTFNEERPHEALGMRTPQEFYESSPRTFDPSPIELVYPQTHLTRSVHQTGSIRLRGTSIAISSALSGYDVGLEPISDNGFMVWFCQLPLGEIDARAEKFSVVASTDQNSDEE
jgi:transposase InsO family protein